MKQKALQTNHYIRKEVRNNGNDRFKYRSIIKHKNELNSQQFIIYGKFQDAEDRVNDIRNNILNTQMKGNINNLSTQITNTRKQVDDEMKKILRFLTEQIGNYQNTEEEITSRITNALNSMSKIVNG